jgi:hypothetical protein
MVTLTKLVHDGVAFHAQAPPTVLTQAVDALIPGARTIRVTPVWTDASGSPRMEFVMLASTSAGQAIEPPRGATAAVAALLRAASPRADWARSHTWTSDGGLRELAPGRPAWMREAR